MPRNFSLTSQIEREAQAVELLDGWAWEGGGCLIGGYAVAAYGQPRFSQDLDFVLPEGSKGKVIKWLETHDFRVRRPINPGRGFRGSTRLMRGDFSIDLMFGYVRDRDTGTRIEEEWISARARHARLTLLNRSTRTLVTVARPEALWLLKIIAGRDQDLADLFAISEEPIDESEVRGALDALLNPMLEAKLGGVVTRLESRKIYSDALSSRAFGKPSDSANILAWSRFLRRVASILPAEAAHEG
jgi:hypothetical protein